jgi:hypothetical protein
MQHRSPSCDAFRGRKEELAIRALLLRRASGFVHYGTGMNRKALYGGIHTIPRLVSTAVAFLMLCAYALLACSSPNLNGSNGYDDYDGYQGGTSLGMILGR